jgi:hypothetical protein
VLAMQMMTACSLVPGNPLGSRAEPDDLGDRPAPGKEHHSCPESALGSPMLWNASCVA